MIKKRVLSFKYALNGIWIVAKSETNFKIQITIAIITNVLGIYFNISKIEWIAIIICIVSVLTAETFNSALEKLVDKISPNYDNTAGIIKDIAAGAVLISAIGSAIIGLIIFLPRIIELFN